MRARYAEPHRRYHTVEHLDEVLDAVEELADLAADARAVRLAALFHDAVYDPGAPPGANEEASARLALEVLGDDPAAEEVARLVRLTATHAAGAGDANGAVLCDADLSILGAPSARYDRYVEEVRAEYAHVDDASWRAGRSALLRRFLDRPRVFATDRFHARLDARARANVARELAALGRGEPEA